MDRIIERKNVQKSIELYHKRTFKDGLNDITKECSKMDRMIERKNVQKSIELYHKRTFKDGLNDITKECSKMECAKIDRIILGTKGRSNIEQINVQRLIERVVGEMRSGNWFLCRFLSSLLPARARNGFN